MAYKILKKDVLNPQIFLMEVDAPLVARRVEPGQFIILRINECGERVPFTVADFDREKGEAASFARNAQLHRPRRHGILCQEGL